MGFRSILLMAAAFALWSPGVPATPASPQLQVHSPKESNGRLSEQGKLDLVRYVDGEYAKVLIPLPHETRGFKVAVGKPLNVKDLQYELRHNGAIANPGDTVQITKLEFHTKDIAVQINGGGKKKFHLREHLQVSMGGGVSAPPIADHPNEGRGTTILLDYGRPVPDLTPDQLKEQLSQFLDFSKHSAAVNWFDTLPPKVQQAIREHRAIVGMDEEMVIAAMGRADHKVREQNAQGQNTTTWIYGTPPAKTVFVIFIHEKVTKVQIYNDPNSPNSANAQPSPGSN